MPTEYSEKDKVYGVEMGDKTSKDFENVIKSTSWGTCDCDDGLGVTTTIRRTDKMVYKPKASWHKKFWNFIKNVFYNISKFFHHVRKVEHPFERDIAVITDEKLRQISRLVESRNGQQIPMNMVRNKKSGVVVVFPGSADKLRSFYGDKAEDYEVVESQIK